MPSGSKTPFAHIWQSRPKLTLMKRSIARLGLLGALFAIIALSTGLLQVMASASASAVVEAVRTGLASAAPTAAALRVEGTPDDSARSDAVTAFLSERFAGVPVEISRTVSAGTVGPVIVEADPQLRDHASLSDGVWASGPGEAVLQSRAAAATGLAVGDDVQLADDISVRVVGLWQPVDARDPYWFSSPAAASGVDDSDLGPLMVDESLIADLPAQPVERWTIVPAEISPALADALAGLGDDLDRAGLDTSIDGGLVSTVQRLLQTSDAATRLTVVPETLVALVALVTLARIATLLWSVRSGETVLLQARGTSRSRLLWAALLEALPVVVLGAALGSVVPGASPTIGVAAAGVALVVLALAALLGIRTTTTVATRRTRTVTLGVTVLTVILAGVALWQYLLYTNSSGANPLGLLAPALGLLALALIAVTIISPVFRLLERLAARRPGISPSLPVRHLARDAAVHATTVLLVVLAVGGATFAAAYSGTASAREARVLESGNGSDVRVHLASPNAVEDPDSYIDPADYSALDGADEAEPTLFTEARVGTDSLELVAAPSSPRGPMVAGSVDVRLRVPAQGSTELGQLELAAWLADPDGQATRVSGPVVAAADAAEGLAASIRVPDGSWTLLAIEARIGGISGATIVKVTIEDVGSGGASVLETPRELNLAIAKPSGRAMLTAAVTDELPVTVTDAASERLSAPIGSPLTLTLPATGGTIDAVVAAIIPVVPGAEGSLAVQTDLAALDDYALRTGQRVPQPNEVWITTDEPDAVADAAVLISRYSSTVSTRSNDDGLAGPLGTVFLIGAAGAALLATIGVAAVAGSLGRQRERDRFVLDALGVSPVTVARTRVAEFTLATLSAVALGLGAGVIAALVFLPTLARSTALAIDPLTLLVVLALTAGCLAVGAMAGRRSA